MMEKNKLCENLNKQENKEYLINYATISNNYRFINFI
jgi:hypothetical protein